MRKSSKHRNKSLYPLNIFYFYSQLKIPKQIENPFNNLTSLIINRTLIQYTCIVEIFFDNKLKLMEQKIEVIKTIYYIFYNDLQNSYMGINNSTNKVSLDQKLLCLQTKIIKPCNIHNKDSVMYCAMPTCQKCPYLCSDCIRDNIHQHQDGIYNQNDFLKAIVTLIENKKADPPEIIQPAVSQPNRDYSAVYKETTKLLEQLDGLEREIVSIIGEYRVQLQSNLDRLAKKSDLEYVTKSSTYINFYSNPNILACKLATQQNDKFLLNLKSQLRANKKRSTSISNDDSVLRLKNEFGAVKSKIRDTLNITNLAGFARKPTFSLTITNPTLKKTFIVSNDSPIKLWLSGTSAQICTNKQLFSVQILTKEVKKIWKQPIYIMSSRNKNQQYIGIINQANQTKMIVYDGKQINQVSLLTKVSSVNILKSKRKLYGLLGQEQGIINVIDLQQNRSVFYYRCGDQPINFIQVCQANSTICCSGKRTPLHIFRFRSKISDDTGELQFQYLLQMSPSILPQGQLQLMKVNNTQLYLFGACRNIIIFDLMLNTQILRTQYKKSCSQFIDAQFVNIGDNQCMVSVNQGESFVNVWAFDKIKRNLRVEEILKDKNQRSITSIMGCKKELWLLREGQKNVDVFWFQD